MLRADLTIWAVALLLCLTIAYGLYNGSAWARFQKRTITAALEEEQERLQEIKEGVRSANEGRTNPPPFRDPRAPFAVGYTLGPRYAAMPPGPLAALAVGQSDLLPYYFKVSLRSRDTLLGNDEIENPVHLLAGRFDLAFVIIYLYPLVILALSYNLLSSEKEDGTLAMTLSQPVSVRSVVLGKVALRGSFMLLLATALSLAGALLSGVDFSAPGTVLRLAMWTAVVAAYGAFWFALSVAVNALGQSSAANALALSGMWLVFVLLVPSLLNVAIKSLHPVPSRVEMIQSLRTASDAVAEQRSQLMSRYFEDHPELAGARENEVTQLAIRNVAMAEELDRRTQPVLQKFDDQLSRQQSLADRYRMLSPAVLTQSALYALAGTDTQRYKHFLGLATSYHREWHGFFNPLMLNAVKFTPAHVDRIPAFRYREEPVESVLRRVNEGLIGLIGADIVMALLALWGLTKYRISA